MGKDAEPRMFTEMQVQVLVAAAAAPLMAKIEELELRIAQLQRDSSTSSSPSKGASAGHEPGKKLKPVCQVGNVKYDATDTTWPYIFADKGAWRILQQIEWSRRTLRSIGHRARLTDGGCMVPAPLPRAIKHRQLCSPRTIGLTACHKGERHTSCGNSYSTLMSYSGVSPTKNRTERQIRFVVIGRKVTQGARAEIGKQWRQRIWTALATCRQRGKQLYHFIVESVQARPGNRRRCPPFIY
ncbi:MAG: hypothetical protein KTR15_16315 [Phycisphaeraceae bacterium]|nr:hypothetical protein [Phycisphaeraceae bacterium]